MPRFAFEKFPQANDRLTTQMKSVGEVMAIGRTFQESFQKALRGLEVGADGMNQKTTDRETIEKELGEPGPERIWYVGDAFENGFTLEEVFQLTKIDPYGPSRRSRKSSILKWSSTTKKITDLDAETLRGLKRKGFSDRHLAYLMKSTEAEMRMHRHERSRIRPLYKRVDTYSCRVRHQYRAYHRPST